jgi:polyhydroxyalkanoate synthesis repressor PhaR
MAPVATKERRPAEGDRSGGAVRIIKKYPNRRLYDTTISSYITLEDVRRLVLEHTSFCVRDAKSNEDITRNILLQIIVDREEGGEPMFTTEVLQQIIRFYGDTLHGMVAAYLDKSMRVFVKQQKSLREQMHSVVSGDPVAFMRELTEQNMQLWREMQQGLFGVKLPGAPRPRRKKAKDEDPPAGKQGS